MEYVNYYNSPLGIINLFSNGKELTGLYFQDQKYSRVIKEEDRSENLLIFKEVFSYLDTYFSGRKPSFIPPIYYSSTNFRNDIWDILLKLQYGETTTYGDIAKKMEEKYGSRKISPRAVGGAVGHNPIAIIIPCHRVVGRDGKLTGYAGGIERKIKLLKLEEEGYL